MSDTANGTVGLVIEVINKIGGTLLIVMFGVITYYWQAESQKIQDHDRWITELKTSSYTLPRAHEDLSNSADERRLLRERITNLEKELTAHREWIREQLDVRELLREKKLTP